MFSLLPCLIALARDECRGAHFKPDFARKSLQSENDVERRREAEQWCDEFERNNRKFLKSTIASWDGEEPTLSYEDVDTSIIPPRPRLYGLVGAEVIEEVWRERTAKKQATSDTESTSPEAATVGN